MSASEKSNAEFWRERFEAERAARVSAEAQLSRKNQQLTEVNQKLAALSQNFEDQINAKTTKLRAARDIAVESARTKDDFLANMSHEIRTPLNGVLGMLFALRQCGNSKQRDQLIDTAISSGKLLMAVINDILDFSKIQSVGLTLENEPFDLRQSIEICVHNFAANARVKGLDLITMIDPAIPVAIEGDGFRLQQVISNLVSNAIKFTTEGNITLSAQMQTPDTILLSVKDTGIGIARNKLSVVTEAFSQADNSITRNFGGTGLGLSISAKILEAMNTTMQIDSVEGLGTTFYFTLPVKVANSTTLIDLYSDQLEKLQILVLSENENYAQKFMRFFAPFNIIRYESWRSLKCAETTSFDLSSPTIVLVDLGNMETFFRQQWEYQCTELNITRKIYLYNYEDVSQGTRSDKYYLLKPVRSSELLSMLTCTENPTQAPRPDHKTKHASLQGVKALIVDDIDVNLVVAGTLLQDLGCTVMTASSGQKAINMLVEHDFDIIFMDIQMPDMDGMETTRHIRAIEGGKYCTPIVAMTAHALESERSQHLQAGMNAHITKPFEPSTLLSITSQFVTVSQRAGDAQIQGTTTQQTLCVPPPFDGYAPSIPLTKIKGNIPLFVKLNTAFYEQFKHASEEYRQFSPENDKPSIQALCHALKGSAANLGFTALSTIAAAIETSLKQGRAPDKSHVDKLLSELNKLKALPVWLNKLVVTSTVHDAPADAKATDIKTVLTALEVSIDRDFGETQDHAAALEKLAEQLDPRRSEVATRVVQNIESFEFEQAKKEISRLKEVI